MKPSAAGKIWSQSPLSGYASSADIQIGKLSGFNHHLTNPCDYPTAILPQASPEDPGTRRRAGLIVD
jgi:hypothetical protein